MCLFPSRCTKPKSEHDAREPVSISEIGGEKSARQVPGARARLRQQGRAIARPRDDRHRVVNVASVRVPPRGSHPPSPCWLEMTVLLILEVSRRDDSTCDAPLADREGKNKLINKMQILHVHPRRGTSNSRSFASASPRPRRLPRTDRAPMTLTFSKIRFDLGSD